MAIKRNETQRNMLTLTETIKKQQKGQNNENFILRFLDSMRISIQYFQNGKYYPETIIVVVNDDDYR